MSRKKKPLVEDRDPVSEGVRQETDKVFVRIEGSGGFLGSGTTPQISSEAGKPKQPDPDES